MLIGEYRHSLDSKGRVNFPAKLREDLGDSFIICKGLDNCLYVYRMSEWDKLVERTAALPTSKARTIQRFFFASAVCAEPDKQGRVLIPETLRDYAGLTNEIAVIGVSTRAEIWDSARWEEANAALTSESVAETMEELGF
ncbi:MAG: division/cell wall cluster transcriptional repressor MraZ [Oscillospiraceae bacterium]|nr:MAG: division/cell wall cluster transcriptional repressor MraZ [Oscillospiraceae bacterium]